MRLLLLGFSVLYVVIVRYFFFFFQAEDGIRDTSVTGVQTCALPIWPAPPGHHPPAPERVPEVRVGQHPADLGGRDERAELDPEGLRAVAVGFRGGQGDPVPAGRSEERRVGKECRSRGWAWHEKEKVA